MDERDELETVCIFRVWKSEGGGVLALFPEIPHCAEKEYLCMSYEHAGQHGAALYGLCIDLTRPATPDEYAELRAELEGAPYGYRLAIRQRAAAKHHQARRDECRRIREADKQAVTA